MNSIFIVEDHRMTARGLAAWFAEGGRWTIAGTAAALEEAKQRLLETEAPPGVILLDLQLSGGESGLNLIAWLREQNALKRIPVVVYSHFSDIAHRNAAIKLGAAAYICKSQSDRELEDALFKIMTGLHAGKTPMEASLDNAAQKVEKMLDCLTKREAQIFLLVRESYSTQRIAAKLGISRRTVENHLSCVYDKTGIRRKDIAGL
jgi:DNA-binding NarL/FixJ family response regulator